MRALLVVNEQATTTSQRSRDVLVRALGSEVELEVAYTRRRGHGTELVRDSGADTDLVVVHGGDGTVNEAVNGLMANGNGAADRPALAVVPGGSTNVFARALGLPNDWGEATGVILEAVRNGSAAAPGPQPGQPPGRVVGLGRADRRYFTFCAGFGIDAAVVRQVEQARSRGHDSTAGRYVRAALGQLALAGRTRADITVEVVGAPTAPEPAAATGLATVVVQNTAPWTYLGDRPVQLCPDAGFDRGLAVLGLRTLRPTTAAGALGRMLSRRGLRPGRQTVRWRDLTRLTVRAESAQPFQVDGEYLGERTAVDLAAVPEALRVLC